MPAKLTKQITIDIPAVPTGILNLEQALKMRIGGLTYQEIADHFGITKGAVCQRLKPLIPEGADLRAYQKHEADILSASKLKVVQSLNRASLKETSPYQQAIMVDILTRNERLIRGKSTSNTAHIIVHAGQGSTAEYERQLGDGQDVVPEDTTCGGAGMER